MTKLANVRRAPIFPPRFCASPVCPFGEDGKPKEFIPRVRHQLWCSPGCGQYERLKRWRERKRTRVKGVGAGAGEGEGGQNV